MQTLNRAKLIFRSHVNDLLLKVEDTRKTHGLMMEDMRDDIRSVKSYIAGAIADLKGMEREVAKHEAEEKRWEDKAVFALKKGEEDLARRALARKCEHINRTNQFREEIATHQETIDSLKSSLKTLEAELDTMRYHSAKLSAIERIESPWTAATPRPSTSATLNVAAFDAYDRVVERVRDLEAHAEALAELTQGDDLDRKFSELENQQSVEEDLAALKSKVAVPS